METQIQHLFDVIKDYLPRIGLAMLILVIGFYSINQIRKLLKLFFDKYDFDETLETFIQPLIIVTLKVVLLISVADFVGVRTTSFVAVLGAASLAIGLAFQGSLSNLAGGVLLLTFRPFKVGDFIETQGFTGTVNRIEILHTTLKTGDNKVIIIPNGALANGSIINYSRESTRRVDMTVGIGYESDLDKAKNILKELVEADTRILKEPTYTIAVAALAASSINFTVRVWVNSSDYWDVFFDFQENIKKRFDQEGIEIPYNKQTVFVKNQ